MMSLIKGKDTRPEQLVRKHLHAAGLRFRLHDRRLPGTPDLVFPKYRAVVFVNGCFWHSHPGCRYTAVPATRSEFWAKKFAATIERDRTKSNSLTATGWRVFTLWECQASDARSLDQLRRLIVCGE